MAVTFGITTEALRRGPIGRVSPITGLSPALTAVLALAFLGERPSFSGGLGVVTATAAVAALGYRGDRAEARAGWLPLAIASFALQGLGAFLSKVIVTPAGPSALLVTSASVQVLVGLWLLRRSRARFPELRDRLVRFTFIVLVLAAVATIGYLWALSIGPASVIVPLVATSPVLGGLLGAIALKERPRPWQYAAIGLGLLGSVLLSLPS